MYLSAAACDKPSVADNQGGCADAVVDEQTWVLVDPIDIGQIERTVIRLLTSEDDARRMARAGRDRVGQEFIKLDQLRVIEKALAGCVND